jgi:phage gp36-like protein
MPLPIYLSGEYKGNVPADEVEDAVYTASRHIDSLTFNRIVAMGYDSLTEFQKEILDAVCKNQIEFEYENSDMIDSVLSSYSINGVSMGIDQNGWNVFVQNGVVMQRSTYEMLKQTGLCCRNLGVG